MSSEKLNTSIIALAASALVLAVILAVIHLAVLPRTAVADNVQSSGGDYNMVAARVTTGDEAVWVLDARSRTVGIYQYDNNSQSLELRRTFSLQAVEGR